LERAMGIEPT